MSRTFRRTDVGTITAEPYMVKEDDFDFNENGDLSRVWFGCLFPVWRTRGSNPKDQVEKTNFRYFTDNFDGYSAPKDFRRMINRSERRRVKLDLHSAISNCMEDEFVDFRAKLPYWD